MMLLVWMSLGLASVEKEPPKKKKEDVCGVVPAQDELFLLAKKHYERHGIWAGIFFLDHAKKQRVEQQGTDDVVYHLQYGYTPVPGNAQGRTDSGWDQRLFLLRCKTEWYVEQMGGYMSAQFP